MIMKVLFAIELYGLWCMYISVECNYLIPFPPKIIICIKTTRPSSQFAFHHRPEAAKYFVSTQSSKHWIQFHKIISWAARNANIENGNELVDWIKHFYLEYVFGSKDITYISRWWKGEDLYITKLAKHSFFFI